MGGKVYMEDVYSRIDLVRRQISDHEKDLAKQYQGIGREIYSLLQAGDPGPVYKKPIQNITLLLNEMEKLDKEKERIRKILERQSEIRESVKSLEKQIRKHEREGQGYYENIGEAAFRAYKSSMLRGQSYANIFLNLLENERSIDNLDDELKQSRESGAGRNVLKFMRKGVKNIFLKTTRSLKNSSLSRMLYKAGRELCISGLINGIAERGVLDAAQPFLNLQQAVRSSNAEIDRLHAEYQQISDELEALISGQRPPSFINRIDSELKVLDKKLNTGYQELGSENWDQLKHNFGENDRVSAKIKAAENMRVLLASDRERMEKLNAVLGVLKKEEKKKEINREIETRNNEIKKAKEDVKDLKTRLQNVENEISELKTLAGSELSVLQTSDE